MAISIGRRLAKGGFYLKEDALGLMNTIHRPESFKLLATYGVYYMPFTLTKALPEPERNGCFANSRALALRTLICVMSRVSLSAYWYVRCFTRRSRADASIPFADGPDISGYR